MLNAFWWGGGKEGGGIRWMAWDRLACPKEEGGIGFRDFKAFNMAMVAKQGWSLLSKPDTLVSRIFKARYFPNNSFLDSSLGYNPSFVWRSIWKSREVLTLGCRWCIGDGSQINIMQEPWFRGSSDGKLGGPQKQEVYHLSVNNLMQVNVKQWDVDIIRDLFDASDMEKILSVPLTEEVAEDKMIWKDEKDGVYSVRTGYNLWRNACWRTAGLSHLIDSRLHSFQDIKSLIFDICSKESREVAGRFAVMLDGIWKNRNDYVWHNEQEEASALGLKSNYVWNEWFQAQERMAGNASSNHVLEWSPPPVGWLKCNVDAAFNNNNGTTNRGWCVRNHFGNFIYAGTAWDPGTLLVFEAEALALKEAILGAISSNLEFVIFESDSQIVTQAVHSNKKGNSEFCLIIDYICSLLRSFKNFEVKFVKRQANSVAHSLARAANSWARRSLLSSTPLCIEHLLINESR
ncbi:uncharacterized protein LOC131648560 [Vicia villosa]|uniref:uncharacterized protein LOC131648560 n=1 Tax=Vicia villosa TaxID=3911 RepID=UPI00273B3ACC|nr:uncharacterized protein LOC131648560 [Vicia villosa]